MQHDVAVPGPGYSLRPVGVADAPRIVALRQASERNRYLHSVSSDVALQVKWLEAYFARPDDWYFAVVRNGTERVEGFLGIYGATGRGQTRTAEWGRWVLEEGSLAAPASALLVYRTAFEHLGLSELYCRTLAENSAVVSFHDRYAGGRRTSITSGMVMDGRHRDVVEHRVPADARPEVESVLAPLAARLAARLERVGTT